MPGISKIKVSLRATINLEDDSETELTPHVNGVTEFEIYESMTLTPTETILPWDSVTQPEYQLNYKVNMGSLISFSVYLCS